MPTVTNQTWGPDGNLIHEETVDRPEDPRKLARQRFRDAVEAATSIADLKAALLGTDTDAEPDVRPGR